MQPQRGLVYVFLSGQQGPVDAFIYAPTDPRNHAGIWDCICRQADAQKLVPIVQAIKMGSVQGTDPTKGTAVTISGTLIVASDWMCPWGFTSLDPSIHYWELQCTIEFGGNTYQASFDLADFLDRAQFPIVSEDMNADDTVGGPNVYLTLIQNPGMQPGFDLRWGK